MNTAMNTGLWGMNQIKRQIKGTCLARLGVKQYCMAGERCHPWFWLAAFVFGPCQILLVFPARDSDLVLFSSNPWAFWLWHCSWLLFCLLSLCLCILKTLGKITVPDFDLKYDNEKGKQTNTKLAVFLTQNKTSLYYNKVWVQKHV